MNGVKRRDGTEELFHTRQHQAPNWYLKVAEVSQTTRGAASFETERSFADTWGNALLTKSSEAENDSFGNNKREKYFLIEHIKQNNERIGEKLDSLYFTLHSLMMMMISLAFLTTSGAVVEDCFHVLDLFFFYFHHTLSRIFFPLAAHAYTAACNTDDNNAGLKIFKRSA